MTDIKVLSFVNSLAATSFESELSMKLGEYNGVDMTIASLYDCSRDNIEIDPEVGSCDFIPLAANRRLDILAYKKLREIVGNFDILHTHFNFSGSVARFLCSLSDVQIVNTEHADHRCYSFLQRLVSFPTFRFADAMVFNSKNTRDSLYWYEEVLFDDSSSYIIYNGVDMGRIDQVASLSKPRLPEGPVILSAGRMVKVKNLDTLVRAFASLLDKHQDVSLVLIGDGPERSKLERLSYDLDIESRVHFLGYLSREQVYSAMHRADLFAVSSYHEGFCNAAVEAMSCGLPIVASDIDVLHEVIGECGHFVNTNDSELIATELQQLLEDDQKRAQLGRAAKMRARNTFPIERAVEEYVNIYTDLLKK